jgi:hypothetical protein
VNNSFTDVPTTNPFYTYIETLYCHGAITGYPCGGVGEPCDPQNRPYFRWFNNAIRAQIAQIVYRSITDNTPPDQCQPPSATATPDARIGKPNSPSDK